MILPRAPLVAAVTTTITASLIRSSSAALPPGYEDEMWCPVGSCSRQIVLEPGFAGPNSAFVECFDPSSGSVVDEVWTGTLSETVAPDGWVVNPDSCPDEVPEEEDSESSAATAGKVIAGVTLAAQSLLLFL